MADRDELSSERPRNGLGLRVRGAREGLPPALALGDPLVVRNLYFSGKQVTVDGYRFEECRFDDCTLVAHSTNFALDRCILDADCVVRYGPSLVKVIQLFTSRYEWLADQLPGLGPTRHPDGTISIGA